MSVFLFTAIVTFLIFYWIAFWQFDARERIEIPPEEHRPESSISRTIFKTLSSISLGLVILLLVYAAAVGLQPPYGVQVFISELIFGKISASVLLGVVFGLLFSTFTYEVFISEPGEVLTTTGKITLGALVALFVLGVGAQGLIDSWTGRLTKLSFGGAAVELAPRETPGAKREQAQERIGSAGGKSANDPYKAGSSHGLTFISITSALIERDCAYYLHIARVRAGLEPTPYKPSKYDPCGFERGFYFGADPAAKGHSTTKSRIEGLRGMQFARRTAKFLTEPLAKCLLHLNAYSWDNGFTTSVLTPLVSPLFELVRADPLAIESHFKAELSDTFARQAIRLVQRVKALFRDVGTERAKLSFSGEITKVQLDKIVVSCAGIIELRCVSANQVSKKTEDVVRKLLLKSVENLRRSCRDATNNFKRVITTGISKWLNDGSFYDRPYFPIILAGLAYQTGERWLAIKLLHDWVENRKNKKNDPILDGWFSARVNNTIIVFLQGMYGDRVEDVPLLVRSYWIDRLQTYIESLEQNFQLGDILIGDRHGDNLNDFKSAAFSRLPTDKHACTYYHRDDNDWEKSRIDEATFKRLYYSYLSSVLDLSQQMMLHQYYGSKYLPFVRKHLENLLRADLSCIEARRKKYIRAQVLGAYGYMQLREHDVLGRLRTSDVGKQSLQNGLRAVDLGLRLVAVEADSHIHASANNKDLSERLRVTTEISALSSLLHLQGLLRRRLNALSN
ncbi:MAG: hypothetical protein JXQ99_05755 [Hyphomicrobiaceae bacterium]